MKVFIWQLIRKRKSLIWKVKQKEWSEIYRTRQESLYNDKKSEKRKLLFGKEISSKRISWRDLGYSEKRRIYNKDLKLKGRRLWPLDISECINQYVSGMANGCSCDKSLYYRY